MSGTVPRSPQLRAIREESIERSRDCRALGDTFTYSEAKRAGLGDRRLYWLRDAGAIVPLGGGVYRWADAHRRLRSCRNCRTGPARHPLPGDRACPSRLGRCHPDCHRHRNPPRRQPPCPARAMPVAPVPSSCGDAVRSAHPQVRASVTKSAWTAARSRVASSPIHMSASSRAWMTNPLLKSMSAKPKRASRAALYAACQAGFPHM